MKPGWKNDPAWRVYHAQRMKDRLEILYIRRLQQVQQEAVDNEAALIVQRVLGEATTNNEPRH